MRGGRRGPGVREAVLEGEGEGVKARWCRREREGLRQRRHQGDQQRISYDLSSGS